MGCVPSISQRLIAPLIKEQRIRGIVCTEPRLNILALQGIPGVLSFFIIKRRGREKYVFDIFLRTSADFKERSLFIQIFLILERKLSSWAHDSTWIRFPFIRNIDIELKFIVIRIEDIETVSNVMVGRTNDFGSGAFEFGISRHKFFIGSANFETDMIEARLWTEFFTRDSIDLDEEQFMMSPAAGEKSHAGLVGGDFVEAECFPIEAAGSFEIGDIEDDVAEFVNFHKYDEYY